LGHRRRAREHALQMLFQIDVTGAGPEEVFREFWRDHPVGAEMRLFAEALVMGVHADRRELDRWIVGSAEHWRIERMAVVDRNVLRMAVHEMLTESAPPPAVVIDEAIEVARRFGSEESGAFVNGVLDDIRKRIEGGAARSSPQGTDGPRR
jgi:N utilization substance protein B